MSTKFHFQNGAQHTTQNITKANGREEGEMNFRIVIAGRNSFWLPIVSDAVITHTRRHFFPSPFFSTNTYKQYGQSIQFMKIDTAVEK